MDNCYSHIIARFFKVRSKIFQTKMIFCVYIITLLITPVLCLHEPRKLSIYEALVITDKKPALNRQVDNFINPLKLFARSNNNETFVAARRRIDTRVT